MACVKWLVFSTVVSLAACTSVVTPPENPADPVDVYLIEEGIHTGVALPRGEEHVEYGYGEWGWYALNHTAWYDVFDTILWPTQGALGRRIVRQIPANAQKLRVAKSDAERLLRELDGRYEARRETEIYNETTRMHLVQVDEDFWCCFTCADAAADWLRSLGCSVSWVLIRKGFRVKP
jgi:hypothetical protein